LPLPPLSFSPFPNHVIPTEASAPSADAQWRDLPPVGARFIVPAERIASRILSIRAHRVMLDSDLAEKGSERVGIYLTNALMRL
jgi:hypothetical protein